MNATPETDGHSTDVQVGHMRWSKVPADFARRLERERDEARKGDWYSTCMRIAAKLAPITKAAGIDGAVDEILAERDKLRAINAELVEVLEGAKQALIHASGGLNGVYGHAQFCEECKSFEMAQSVLNDHHGFTPDIERIEDAILKAKESR